jgi:hypothetical protein
MCSIYALYAAVWTILCFCYVNELLRIQHWIGAVIFLGKNFFIMVESELQIQILLVSIKLLCK